MARKRMIDPNIWNSEDFSKLSSFAKLVFIGLFSQADDEGRGRANPTYLKSILFPYEEAIRAADIKKTLSEIASTMSVTFYTHDEKEYYVLESWDKFQTINKPTPSTILLPKDYGRATVGLPPNRKEEKRKEVKDAPAREDTPSKKFIPPSLEQVQEYCAERKNNVDAGRFIDFYSSKGWMIGKNKMKDWKAAVRTWERGDRASPGMEPRLVDGGFEL